MKKSGFFCVKLSIGSLLCYTLSNNLCPRSLSKCLTLQDGPLHSNFFIQPKKGQLTVQHALVSPISNGIDVGCHFIPPLSHVHLDHGLSVYRKPFVGVHRHTEQSRIGLKNFEF